MKLYFIYESEVWSVEETDIKNSSPEKLVIISRFHPDNLHTPIDAGWLAHKKLFSSNEDALWDHQNESLG